MKICFLANISSSHNIRWVRLFAEMDHEVSVISLEEPYGEINGVSIHVVKTNKKLLPITLPLKIRKLKRLIKQINPDLVHAHFITKYGFIGALGGCHPLLISAWGSDLLRPGKSRWIWNKIAEFTIKRADGYHCDGIKTNDALLKLRADSSKIHLIYFGVDVQRNKPERRSEKIRSELGIGDSIAVISLRSFRPVYDIASLIKAIPKVLAEVPDTKFILVGGGPLEAELKKLAQSLGVSNNTVFTGFVQIDNIPKYLASADIYVSTSLRDAGIAASTSEAMACGLPVVITDDPDNRIWVQDNRNGFIVPTKDPNSLAEKILYLIKNEGKRKEFGKINRQLIIEKNNLDVEMKKIEVVYEEIVKKSK